MITVKEYRGHIRNWEALCVKLKIDPTLSREEREPEILKKAYETWGCEIDVYKRQTKVQEKTKV